MSRVIIGLEDVVPFSTYQKIYRDCVSITRKSGNRRLFPNLLQIRSPCTTPQDTYYS